MANLKMLKLPKKPKSTASNSVMERYIARVKEIKKENTRREQLNKKRASLQKQISGISAVDVRPNRFSAFTRPKAKSKSKPKAKAKRKTSISGRRKKSKR